MHQIDDPRFIERRYNYIMKQIHKLQTPAAITELSRQLNAVNTEQFMTPEQRRINMQHIRSKDTSIEIKLRTALWHEGIRYRKNYRKVPGKPDIAITKYKIAVFCDSSFWHGRDFDTKKPVETNHEYWEKKIKRNMQRDLEVNQQLKELDWTVLRFWDTDINKHLDECIQVIKKVIYSVSNK